MPPFRRCLIYPVERTPDELPPSAPDARRRSRTTPEFIRFVIFGAVNTVASYSIYLLLLVFVAYPVAYTGSFVCGMFMSYCLNAAFVFREKLRLSRALQYPVVYLVQYLVGLAVLYLLVELFHVSPLIAPFAVVAVTLPITYSLSRYMIKR